MASGIEGEPDPLELEHLGVLLDERVLGLLEDADERVLVQVFQAHHHGQPSHQLGDQPEALEVLGFGPGQEPLTGSTSPSPRLPSPLLAPSPESDPPFPIRDSTIFSSPSKAPPQMKRMLRVSIWMYSCWGCFRPPWGGTEATVPSRILSRACWTPSPETSRVIDGFSDFPRDLVDLVDVDDAPLAVGDVVVRGLEEAHQDVLDVLADVPRLGQRRRVRDREGDVEDPGEGLGQEGLADPGRAHEEDVGLLHLDVVEDALVVHPLVVVVDRHREGLLRVVLTDHILVEGVLDLAWGEVGTAVSADPLLLLREDLVAERHALVADVDAGPGDELPDRVLGLSAEAAAEVLVSGHGASPSPSGLRRAACHHPSSIFVGFGVRGPDRVPVHRAPGRSPVLSASSGPMK
jgi:hypothetical protein